MSISSAPMSTASRISSRRESSGYWPLGNPPATAATLTPVSFTVSTATGTSDGYTHTAATWDTVWSVGSGRTALADIWATFPGVSMPSSVVRSMHRMARSSAHSFDSRLMDRVASEAARSSRPTASTEVTLATKPATPPGPTPVGWGFEAGISAGALAKSPPQGEHQWYRNARLGPGTSLVGCPPRRGVPDEKAGVRPGPGVVSCRVWRWWNRGD